MVLVHFAEVIRNTTISVAPSMESAVDSCYTFLEGCYTDLPRHSSLFKTTVHTYTYVHLQQKAFLDWHWFCTVCSNTAICSRKCCTSLKEILQVTMLLHSLHRHVARVYSKKFVLHCFKPYSTSCTKILHILKTFCKSHSTLFKTKQDCNRTAVLFERKYCKSWCCTCFKTEKKTSFLKRLLHHQWNLQ